MAIFYMNVQIIGRRAGRSATGAAAYRAGERIRDERTGRTYDYTRRQGEIETHIMAPEQAPEWVHDRSQLWNRAELAERRVDAQVAREMVVAFPQELNPDEQRELIRSYVREQFVDRGMVADMAIHRNPGNPHAHVMLTMREIGPEGFAATKNREWNRPEHLERWREEWARESNRALERSGREERIDHRSLREQGIERLPQVHLGPRAAALEERGIETDRGEHNRAVAEHNRVVIDLERAREAKRQLMVEREVTERYYGRLNQGWLPVHAESIGRLEFESGGRELKEEQLRRRLLTQREELHAAHKPVHEIRREEERLSRAAQILDTRQRAADDLTRMKRPLGRVKRWFSKGAREEFESARDWCDYWDREAGTIGTTSKGQLQEQRAAWEKSTSRLPELGTRIGSLDGIVKLIERALDGFQFLREMEHQRERYRDRDRDRGRER